MSGELSAWQVTEVVSPGDTKCIQMSPISENSREAWRTGLRKWSRNEEGHCASRSVATVRTLSWCPEQVAPCGRGRMLPWAALVLPSQALRVLLLLRLPECISHFHWESPDQLFPHECILSAEIRWTQTAKEIGRPYLGFSATILGAGSASSRDKGTSEIRKQFPILVLRSFNLRFQT